MSSSSAPQAPNGFVPFLDKQSGQWHYEDQEREYEFKNGAWHVLAEEQIDAVQPLQEQTEEQQQQAAYAVDGVDEAEPVEAIQRRREKAERKKNGIVKEPKERVKTERGTTAVYVTGLTSNTTREEVIETFGKFGLLLTDADGPKVKLYNDAEGHFKGEALVVYAAAESATQAIELMDGMEFRPAQSDVIHVAMATFDKKQKHAEDEDQAAKRKRAKVMEEKKSVWALDDVDDGFGPTVERQSEQNSGAGPSKTVVLKYMFTLAELAEDPSAAMDIKEDVREECEASFGVVTAIHLYDDHPLGVITVKFLEATAAQACVLKNDGRLFAGRRVSAALYDGQEKFTSKDSNSLTDQAEAQRLDDFGDWLEREEKESE